MTEQSLQKISHILLSNKNLAISPHKTLTNFQKPIIQLNDDTIKAKLQTCLYSLNEVNKQIKKGKFSIQKQQNKAALLENNLKAFTNTEFPTIQGHNQKSKALESSRIINKTVGENQTLQQKIKSNRTLNQFLNSSLTSVNFNQTLLKQQKSNMFKPFNTAQPLLKYIKNEDFSKESINSTAKFSIKLKNKFEKQKQKSPNKQNQIKRQQMFHPKVIKHLYESGQGKALSKENRYFSSVPAVIDLKQVSKLGLYESSNRFRKEMITEEMKNLSPKIQKKQLEFVKVCKQNELFLTRPKQLAAIQLDDFLKEQFIINEARPKRYFQTIHTQQLYKLQNNIKTTQHNTFLPPHDNTVQNMQFQDPIAQLQGQNGLTNYQANIVFIQIRNYSTVKCESFVKFKVQNIEVWQQIESLLQQIARFLKQLKINSCRFKANNLLDYWSGKRLSISEIQKILKISRKQFINRKQHAMANVFNICYAKRKMKAIIKNKQKKLGYMKWVCDRIIGIRSIKKQSEYKINKAYEIHERLLDGEYNWDTEIYISSFSQNQFVRNTTQYMESFQNMFAHMWKESSKHMILVIPTINSQILEIYQEKLKIKRSITLICPEVHQLFPVNMSLAGCLLFSYQALNKIKQLIQGKNAVIIPGKFSQPKYELLISQFLRSPLMTSLKPRKDLQFQKQLFSTANLQVLPYISIRPQTKIDQIVQRFAKLVISYNQINKWMFKINGQFGGRGLATFSIKSSKVLRSILSSCKVTIKPLEEYLKRNLKLKLKINFQNSLFMLGDYLQRLSEKGGLIQEHKQNVESYEISLFIENKNSSSLVSCFKSYSVNLSNKAYIYEQSPNFKISGVISKLKNILQMNSYLGYVSVNLLVSADKVYGVEIKPYMTQLTSVEPFIKSIQSKRQLKLNFSNPNHKIQNELISSILRNQFFSKRQQQQNAQHNPNNSRSLQNRLPTENSHLFSNINLSITQLQTLRPNLGSEFTYLFIPNIILTDVSIPKKAQFIESLVLQNFTRRKFDILDNNLVLYLSNGLSLNLLIVGKDIKKIKKTAVQVVRFLSEKTGALKIYCGKNEARDVFQFGDIIKAVTQIKG